MLYFYDKLSLYGYKHKDLRRPAGPLPAGILVGLRPRVDQTCAILSRDFPQAIQAHGPDRPAGHLEPRPASPTEG
jgi:hypothetical protein